jgi:hypothetical protein
LRSGSKKDPTTSASPDLERWQSALLDAVARSPLARTATFGGATALAAVYLHHRSSEDLDFFLPRDATRAEVGVVTTAARRLHLGTEVRTCALTGRRPGVASALTSRVTLGEQLLKVNQIRAEDLPRMIKPLLLEDLRAFLEDAARRLVRRGP